MLKLDVKDFEYFGCKVKNVEPYIDEINICFQEINLITDKEIVACLANVLLETGCFRYMSEIAPNGNVRGGHKYKGRGLVQLTHDYNYKAFNEYLKGRGLNYDVVTNPDLVATVPKLAVMSLTWFWEVNGFSELAKQGRFRAICGIWNAGRADAIVINGWNERLAYKHKVESWILEITKE